MHTTASHRLHRFVEVFHSCIPAKEALFTCLASLVSTVFLLLLGLPLSLGSQEFKINEAVVESGSLRLGYTADTNLYYVLERANELSRHFTPIAMELPASSSGVFLSEIGGAYAFYRLEAVSVTAPLDSDGDGIDDLYELRRRPELNPFDPADANEDPDGDGLTRVQAYRGLLFDETAKRVGVGDGHFLILRADGTLWAAGNNRFGQLGDGSTNNASDLIPIAPANRWAAVAAGGGRSYGILTDGSLWAWGRGSAFLGDGVTTNHLWPTRIGNENDWERLAASASHTVAIRRDGTLWAWGINSAGQLGDGSRETRATPVRVGDERDWVDAEVGQNLTIALKTDGRVFACGYNEWGQLGTGATNLDSDVLTPVAPDFRWRAIGAGDFHGLAIRSDNTLWGWGQFIEDGGNGSSRTTNYFTPTQIGANTNWLRVVGGYQHSVAVDLEGSLWAFGYNAFGEVGDGTRLPRPNPTQIARQERWAAVATQGQNHVGIRQDGTLWNWTTGVNGQFIGAPEKLRPVMPHRRFQAIAAGDNHSLALDEFGAVWAWGANEVGQLGDGTAEPGLPRTISTNLVCRYVSAGGRHSLAVDASNQLWAWGWLAPGFGGSNTPWLLTDGSSETQPWQDVDCGGSHLLALDRDGHLLFYGESAQGQRPDASFNTNAFSAISAGLWSSLAVDEAGALYVWGRFSSSSFPTYYGLVSTPGFAFQRVIGGAMHSLVIRSDGTLWSMGDNKWGQLGIGTNSYPGLLKPVMTNFSWRAAAAYYHNLAIRADGTLWFWGYDGSSAVTRTPVQISTNTSWRAVAAGYKHSLALEANGSLWAWGDNTFGQLGVSPFRQYGAETNWRPPPPARSSVQGRARL